MSLERRKILQASAMFSIAAAAGWIAFPTTAKAAPDATVAPTADILQLKGTNPTPPGPIDPKVGNVAQLKKAPLSAYNTYSFLKKDSFPINKGTPASYTLANGRILQLTFEDMTKDNRYRVLTTVSNPNATTFLSRLEVVASPNETLFWAGQNLDTKNPDKGALVFGITIRP